MFESDQNNCSKVLDYAVRWEQQRAERRGEPLLFKEMTFTNETISIYGDQKIYFVIIWMEFCF